MKVDKKLYKQVKKQATSPDDDGLVAATTGLSESTVAKIRCSSDYKDYKGEKQPEEITQQEFILALVNRALIFAGIVAITIVLWRL